MKKTDLDDWILRHDARNLQLKRRLAERGVDLRDRHRVTCYFRSPDQRQAALLAQALSQRCFTVRGATPSGHRVKPSSWQVEAEIEQSIEQVASHEFTETVVRVAAACSSVYEGWYSRIGSAGSDEEIAMQV